MTVVVEKMGMVLLAAGRNGSPHNAYIFTADGTGLCRLGLHLLSRCRSPLMLLSGCSVTSFSKDGSATRVFHRRLQSEVLAREGR